MHNQIERRQFGRRKVCKPAHAIYSDGTILKVVVVDISAQGAGLQSSDANTLPENFELLIHADDMIVACRVVHRSDRLVGVCFLASPRIASRANTEKSTEIRAHLSRALRSRG